MLAKRLAGVHIGEVNLDNREINGGQGIPYCDTRVRVSRGVDNNTLRPIDIIPNEGYNCAFGVRLKNLEAHALF